MKHELSSMKAFVILAESSSFNNAAKLLNITQPALTRRIKKMEEDLHIQLFERTTRKVTLTKAGKRLLPEARELIKKFDETLFNIRDMNAYHRGMVTLACIPTAVFYFLPLAIGKFNELYPNIKVRILEQGTNNCMESVLCNESDFGINMNNVTNSSIDFTPLVNEPFVLACRRDHPLAKKQLVEWQELVGYKMIGVRSSSGNRLLIEQQLADKPEAGLVLRSASSFDVIRTSGGRTGDFGASWSGNAPCALFFDYWYPTGGTRYTSDIGDYSPQRCRAFSGS